MQYPQPDLDILHGVGTTLLDIPSFSSSADRTKAKFPESNVARQSPNFTTRFV